MSKFSGIFSANRRYSLKINAASNFVGSAWTALISLIFVPVYLRYLGVESYGVIGVFASVQAFMWLFDFGLSPTLSRELARLSVLSETEQEMRDTARTLELLNWTIAAFIGIVLLIISPLFARYWVHPEKLSVTDVTQCFIIMSINFAFQYPTTFYSGGLIGLQKQLVLNLTNISLNTIKALGSVAVLIFVSNTIQSFLIWQAAVSIFQTLLLALLMRFNIPATKSPSRFRSELLKKVWRFAVGMIGINIVSLVLVQTDKIVLSRMLTLEFFGYYVLATTVSSMAIAQISSSLSTAIYPKFSQLVALGDEESLKRLYHQSCQLMSILLLPTAAVLVFFSHEVLLIWTRDETVSANTALLLSLVAAGTGFHGLMWIPYQLQLAYGWTKLSFYVNVGAVLILIPLMLVGVNYYGAVGGATSWLTLCFGYVLIGIPLMHRKILRNEKAKWYLFDVGVPLLTTFCIMIISSRLLPAGASAAVTIIWIILSWAGCVLTGAVFSSHIREKLFEIIQAKYTATKWRDLRNES